MRSPIPAGNENVRRRHFVAVATSTYDEYDNLPVQAEVEQLQRWLTDRERLGERAFNVGSPKVGPDPSEDDIRAAFRRPNTPWTERDAAVVFVTGHGEVADGSHWLVLGESERADLPNTAVRTAELIRSLHREGGVGHLLLIIDACFAGAAAADTVKFDRTFPKTWLILPSASRNGTAMAGALTTAIAAAVEELQGPLGAKHGTNRRYFLVGEFVDTVKKHLNGTHSGQEMDPLGYTGEWTAEHICLPNPHYAEPDTVATQPQRHELALPKADLATHWAPRQSGTTAAGQWLFTGRADLMRDLIARATPDPQAASSTLLVTGGAGSGKSSVLARLVTLSDPDFVAAWADRVAEIPDGLRPPIGAVDVAVLATGKYPHEVISQINAALDADNTPIDLNTRVEACRGRLSARAAAGQRTVLVVDALDEAADPLGVAGALARLTRGQGVALFVGVRSPSGPADPLASFEQHGPLADRVERLTSASRTRVDEDPWWRQDDLRDYAASFLRHTPGSPYTDPGRHKLAHRLAEVIAARVGRSFLIARLAANALTQRDHLVDPSDAAWLVR